MFTLPKLDYSYDALEPFIDAKTMELHYTKHHQTYVDKLNAILDEAPALKDKSLEELCVEPYTKNMAGGHFNHSFWWKMIGPPSQEKIPDEILQFKDEFTDKSLKLFGSGWVWLAKQDGILKVLQSPLQDSLHLQNATPVFGIDLWEHAYYLKYQNRRAEYVENFWNVVNWNFVKQVLAEK